MAFFRQISRITKLINSLQVSGNTIVPNQISRQKIHTTIRCNDLMEFFDDKKNWGEREVKTGRSWRLEELRIKSNSDLHKLWFILLKEKNMLLTMEEAAKDAWSSMANPERLDKVEVSMENLEQVVRERNRAYWMLEVGETGERPHRQEVAFTGLDYRYYLRQHRIPEALNYKHKYFKNLLNRFTDHPYQKKFLSLFREQRWNERRRKQTRDFNHVCGLFKRFPNMDVEALREQYPGVDIDMARSHQRTRGHRDDNTA